MKFAFMPRRAIAATAGLAMMLVGGVVTDAQAAATTYTLSGTLDWTNADHDSISGTVTYNPVGHVASLNVTIAKISGSGAANEVGTWNGAGIYDGSNGPTTLFSAAGPANLYLIFGTDLNSVPATETLTSATWICGAGCRLDTTATNVAATSAPEPASLAILGAGLAFLSLTGRSWFRRTVTSSSLQTAGLIG